MAKSLRQRKVDAKAQGWAKWIRSEPDERALLNGCTFDVKAGEHVVKFFGYLRLWKGEWYGKPFVLIPYQRDDIIMPIFGWKRADGTRRYRIVYIEMGKKQGKSALGSGLELYMLVGDGEMGAEVYTAAADRFQAGIVHNEAAKMAQASPDLAPRLNIIDSRKRITYPRTGSFMQALSAEAYTKEGLNIHGLVFDELHAQKNRVLWDTLRYGGAARRQPLILSITTAGWDRTSICWEQHDYAEKVRDGIIEDDSFFGYIRAADIEDDWTDRKVWAKANPSLGIIVKEDELATMCREAQESPAKENSFRRYRLCQWTEQATRWLAMHVWDANSDGVDATDWKAAMAWRERMLAELAGQPCWAGLDLANTKDIAALVLMFPVDADFVVLPWFWVPKVGAQRRERVDRVPYLTWARQGFITLTEGNSIDYRDIRATINTIGKDYGLQDIGFDPFNATHLATELIEEDGFAMVQFRQGAYSYNEPMKAFEGLLLDGHIRHGANPVLSWMASNIAVKTDAQANIYPAKDKSAEKIDGICAAVMGLARAMFGSEQSGSVYEGRGVLTL